MEHVFSLVVKYRSLPLYRRIKAEDFRKCVLVMAQLNIDR